MNSNCIAPLSNIINKKANKTYQLLKYNMFEFYKNNVKCKLLFSYLFCLIYCQYAPYVCI